MNDEEGGIADEGSERAVVEGDLGALDEVVAVEGEGIRLHLDHIATFGVGHEHARHTPAETGLVSGARRTPQGTMTYLYVAICSFAIALRSF